MEMSIERSIVAVRNGVVEKFSDMVGLVYHGIVVLWRMADHFIFFRLSLVVATRDSLK